MTRDEILRLAREAGFKVEGSDVLEGDGYHVQTNEIERFAALIIDHERDAACKRVIEAYKAVHKE